MSQSRQRSSKPIALASGQVVPWGRLPEGASLSIGAQGISLHIALPRPMQSEISAIRRGPLFVGVLSKLGHGLLVWQFRASNGEPPIVFDSPFHIGRNPNPDARILPARAPSEHRSVFITIQDESAVFRGGRYVTLPLDLCMRLDNLIAQQVADQRSTSDIMAEHMKVIGEMYREYPSPTRMINAASPLARAGS